MSTAGNSAPRKLNVWIVAACMIGANLSYYGYVVETRKEVDKSYVPLCDISEDISCTKVFMTEYGQGFGLFPKDSIFNIPNTLYGLGFYGLAAVLGMINNHACTGVLSVLALLSDICSIYLAFILYMYRIICVVCVTTYIINAAITYFAIKKFRKLSCDDVCKKKK